MTKMHIMIIDTIKITIIIIKMTRFAMHIVNGAGSAPHQEQPEIVNKQIAKFIKGEFCDTDDEDMVVVSVFSVPQMS